MLLFKNRTRQLLFFLTLLLFFNQITYAQRVMEQLDRALVAVGDTSGKVLVSWRMLGSDAEDITFNLYRNNKKLNEKPLSLTNFFDSNIDLKAQNVYKVKAIVKGKEEKEENTFTLKSDTQGYLKLPLQTPEGYNPNDASVGDLDGDGTYEIVLHQVGKGYDNSQKGIATEPVLEAYKLDGTMLWRINLGKNIREGAHYTQFMVYDFDGDGRAEVACKTADGTKDGKGKIIGDATKDWRTLDDPNSGKYGMILQGPEYFTIFDGKTGAALATTDYIPTRFPIEGWGSTRDVTGNRADRFLACVAYLDGKLPSVVMCRGYYGRTVLAAWDWRNGKLTSRWVFDSQKENPAFSGQGYHNLTVADVDKDGKDEIIYGSMVVDDNGKGLFTTGLGHGDALHVSDLDPEREGLEVFGIHEIKNEVTTRPGIALYDARTGKILFQTMEGKDVGRGVAEDIDPTHLGAEMWGGMVKDGKSRLLNCKGEDIGVAPNSVNFVIWWDGDLTRELLDGNHIDKYKAGRLLTAKGCLSNNGTKSTPVLSADILGDWREEVIFREEDGKSLRIYTTTYPTTYRFPTLMHDPQYRLSIAWQNVGYNQPPHTGFYLGEGMKPPAKPDIVFPKRK
jgi:rhamnogalacturonan endolyase